MNNNNLFFIMILIILLCSSVSSVSYDTKYDIIELPFSSQKNITLQGFENQTDYTIVLGCLRTIGILANSSSCPYSIPSITNISFLNNTESNITFNISIPSGVDNSNIKEEWELYLNGTDKINNFSIIFNYNISVPAAPIVPANINITSFYPVNNSFIGQFNTIPKYMEIKYDGNINFNNSVFILKKNNLSIYPPFIHNETLPKRLNWNLTDFIIDDGIYELNMILMDNINNTKSIFYKFEIKQSKPIAPLNITPNKGKYTDEIVNLNVIMDSTEYYIYYMVSDSYPPIGSSSWKQLTVYDSTYSILNLNMHNAGLGQIYLKIIDKFGNIRIHPTQIISAPSFKFNIEDRSKSVEPGDEIILEMQLDVKPGSGTLLKCKMNDFIANKGKDSEQRWSIGNTISLQTKNYDEEDSDSDQKIDLEEDYYDALNIGTATNILLELNLLIPRNVALDHTFDSKMQCIIS